MTSVSFNIVSGSGSVLSDMPTLWVLGNIREFTDAVRYNCLTIAKYAAEYSYTVKSIKLHVNIYEDLNEEEYHSRMFIINCKNIREYKKYIKMTLEDLKKESLKEERQLKINSILE